MAGPARRLPLGIPAVLAMLMVGAPACTSDPEVRPQTLLVVDTDLPVAAAPGELPFAAMDTLRVDVLDGAKVLETRELVLGDPLDWPVSLGAVGQARLRLRLFRASLATSSGEGGARVLEPRMEVAVDRLVDLGPPTGGVSRRRVLLTGECIGFVADVASGITCISRERHAARAEEGIVADERGPTQVGTWSRVTPAPCTTPDVADRPCVPGSFDVIGDLALTANPSVVDAPLPLRAVVVSPFRMDRTEVTVGRYRTMLAGGWKPRAPGPLAADPTREVIRYCTFIAGGIVTADDKPLNCVTLPFAKELCAASGGRLPTEAEWEHAARGRDGRPFPWGDATPECCTTSASRSPEPLAPATCPLGIERVGSHVADGKSCPGGGDVSREGILDLGGSLAELTSDYYDSVVNCRHAGLTLDPTCMTDERKSVVLKGADWTSGLSASRSAFRAPASMLESSLDGFRCVYPEPAP